MECKFIIEISVKSVKPKDKQDISQVHAFQINPNLIKNFISPLIKNLAQEFPKEDSKEKKEESKTKPKKDVKK